ncbi:MAG: O-antigen ligase family protein [Pseudomonadota bacterium]
MGTSLALRPSSGIRWRTLEWAGAAFALFLHTGAIFPLLFLSSGELIDSSERSILRVVSVPAYLISLVFLARFSKSFFQYLLHNSFLLLILLLPFISIIWSISTAISFRRAIAVLLSALLAYFISMRFTVREQIMLFFSVTFTLVCLSLVSSVAASGMSFSGIDGSFRGVFTHKNVLGWYSAVAMGTAVFLILDPAYRLRGLGFVALGLSFATLILASSITALFAIMCSFGMLAFLPIFRKQRSQGRLLLLIIGIQVGVLLMFSMEVFVPEILAHFGRDATLTGRVPLWAHVDHFIAQQPLTGYGFQAFWERAAPTPAWVIWTDLQWDVPHAHNGIRDVLLSFGLIGGGLFFVLLARSMVRACNLYCQYPDDGWLWLASYFTFFIALNLAESKYFAQNDFFFIVFLTGVISTSRIAVQRLDRRQY